MQMRAAGTSVIRFDVSKAGKPIRRDVRCYTCIAKTYWQLTASKDGSGLHGNMPSITQAGHMQVELQHIHTTGQC